MVQASLRTSTAQFLKLGVGARAVAMGEAYSAIADEASAVYWNPGALTNIESRSATLMHAIYLEDTSFDYAAFVQNLGRWGVVGLGVQIMSVGSIDERDDTGSKTGTFSPATGRSRFPTPKFYRVCHFFQ